MTFCSAPSRIAQVLMITRSAVSIDDASAQPAESSRPAISSESLRFIWQPSVQTWKRGNATRSGTYSPSRSSAGAAGRRGATVEAGALGGRTSRTGSERVDRRVSLTAAPWYAQRRARPAILDRHGPPRPLHVPRDLGRPADADRSRDRPRHRQRHLHLDPRAAPAGAPARSGPLHRPGAGDGDADPPAPDDLLDHRPDRAALHDRWQRVLVARRDPHRRWPLPAV